MKPNIFEIATSELSQDGFITWLLLWADKNNKQYDEKLHYCAVDFVKLLINKQYQKEIEVDKVKAGRQQENIDIWAVVNDKYCIIIEDKTYTAEHSDQLERYKKICLNWCAEKKWSPIFIYLKTGTEAMTSLRIVEEKGFSIVNRSDLLKFFDEHNTSDNDIYLEFYEKIRNLENAEKAYLSKQIKDWDWSCWIGFYNYLDTMLEITGWNYVSNPNGGFLGMWWNFVVWENFSVYLQISQDDLCFKIDTGVGCENCSEIRNKWYEIIMKVAEQTGKNEIIKPSRFGNGRWMTAAMVKREDWLGRDNEIVNREKVVECLKSYESFLNIAKDYKE